MSNPHPSLISTKEATARVLKELAVTPEEKEVLTKLLGRILWRRAQLREETDKIRARTPELVARMDQIRTIGGFGDLALTLVYILGDERLIDPAGSLKDW